MNKDERIKVQDRILILTLFVQTLVLVSQIFTISIYAQQSYQASMIPTAGGETLQVHLSTDTGRPKGILDHVVALMRGIRSSFSGTWIGSYYVGGVERENATVSIGITVTGSNVASTALVDYYVEARSGEASYRFLEATGQSVTVGGSALQASDPRTITGHLEAMSLATTQSWTIDYYVYVKAEATGSVSGETLTSEITETKFDTKTYEYGTEVTDTYYVMGLDDAQYTGSGGGYSATANYIRAGDNTETNYDYQTVLRFPGVAVTQGKDFTDARLKLYTYRNTVDPTLTVKGEAVDNAAQITSAADFLSRARTGASASWSGFSTGAAWNASPDAQAIVEEIVGRGGWASGNAVQFFISDPSGFGGVVGKYITTETFECDQAHRAKLELSYIDYEASWYPLPPLSLASLPITIDVVAWSALIAATALAWRENRRKMK